MSLFWFGIAALTAVLIAKAIVLNVDGAAPYF